MSYRLTAYDPLRLPEILSIERALWSEDPEINAAYFDWKYLQNPLMEHPHLYLVLHRDQVVGVRGFHGTAWHFGPAAEPEVTPTGGDTVILPSHRSRGLFERLNRYALESLAGSGFRLLCSFSAAAVTYLRSVRGGWRPVGSYLPLTRDKAGGPMPELWDRDVRIEDEPLPAAMATLADETGPRLGIRPVRNEAFQAWRYRNPLSRYVFLYAGGAKLDGYMVLQTRHFRSGVDTRIVDWAHRELVTFEALLHTALRVIETDRLTVWSATLPTPVRGCLERAGFHQYDDRRGSRRYRPGPLVVMPGTPGEAGPWRLGGLELTDLANWHLRMICSDSC